MFFVYAAQIVEAEGSQLQ